VERDSELSFTILNVPLPLLLSLYATYSLQFFQQVIARWTRSSWGFRDNTFLSHLEIKQVILWANTQGQMLVYGGCRLKKLISLVTLASGSDEASILVWHRDFTWCGTTTGLAKAISSKQQF
jgi:hypothetical protein